MQSSKKPITNSNKNKLQQNNTTSHNLDLNKIKNSEISSQNENLIGKIEEFFLSELVQNHQKYTSLIPEDLYNNVVVPEIVKPVAFRALPADLSSNTEEETAKVSDFASIYDWLNNIEMPNGKDPILEKGFAGRSKYTKI